MIVLILERNDVMKTGVNLFDHPLNSGDTFPEIVADVLKNFFATIAFFVLMYLFACFFFCLQVGTEYCGPYMPAWHWPFKLLAVFS